nr:MAG TPA: hypothetical protein [Caudoviricetes sp.]
MIFHFANLECVVHADKGKTRRHTKIFLFLLRIKRVFRPSGFEPPLVGYHLRFAPINSYTHHWRRKNQTRPGAQ